MDWRKLSNDHMMQVKHQTLAFWTRCGSSSMLARDIGWDDDTF